VMGRSSDRKVGSMLAQYAGFLQNDRPPSPKFDG
jgi:hypothetical protein